ncbi:hypothetical protein [Sutcliffiella deserti]|uniref:hypothetical protein n=1 Tax=Sutcliffiella deserti TaxID=2875501 RepID=UPI001CBF8217|nr:hypothetical protein [Sutcliffiella deserti]
MLIGLTGVTIAAIIIILLISKGKINKVPFIWFIANIIILALSTGWALFSLNPRFYNEYPQSMALDTFTFHLYMAAFGWVIGILFLLIGIRLSFK